MPVCDRCDVAYLPGEHHACLVKPTGNPRPLSQETCPRLQLGSPSREDCERNSSLMAKAFA